MVKGVRPSGSEEVLVVPLTQELAGPMDRELVQVLRTTYSLLTFNFLVTLWGVRGGIWVPDPVILSPMKRSLNTKMQSAPVPASSPVLETIWMFAGPS